MDEQRLIPEYFVDLATGKIHHTKGNCSKFKFFHSLEEVRAAGYDKKCKECLKAPFAIPLAFDNMNGSGGMTGAVVVNKRKRSPGEIVIQNIPDPSYLKGTIVRKRILGGEKAYQSIVPNRSYLKGMSDRKIKIK